MVTICISTMSVVVQMVILNLYYKAPLTPYPTWLKRVKQYLTCRSGITTVEDI